MNASEQSGRRRAPWMERLRQHPGFIRLVHWEYWPMWAFYFPMLWYYPLLALRARHLCFFTAANPGIYTGGLGMESKYDTLMKIPEEWRPRTIRTLPGEAWDTLQERLAAAGIGFPLIAKPDMGLRGFLVTKILDAAGLRQFLEQHPLEFILQEFISKPQETGVLYYRLPREEKGQITSLTFKEFLHVKGNGRDTLRRLIRAHPRALLQWERLQRTYMDVLDSVPNEGETIPLGEIGNHAKGTRFIDGSAYIDNALSATFDRVACRIEGFHYGRFDIRCDSIEALRQGRDFVILELNGVCSEPTHIYDAQVNTYGFALREILRHWGIIFRVGTALHRRGTPYLPAAEMIAAFRRLFRHLKQPNT